jgi:Mg-chelatase subunit ChlD
MKIIRELITLLFCLPTDFMPEVVVSMHYKYQTDVHCTFSGCRRQVDIVFVLDMSGSTKISHKRAREVTREIVTDMDMSFGQTRVGLVTYGDEPTIHFYLNTYTDKEEILNAISFLPEGQKTVCGLMNIV